MKCASDFRSIARNALSGRWSTAVWTGVVASILGVGADNGLELKLNFSGTGSHIGIELSGEEIYTMGTGWNEQLVQPFLTGAAYLLIAVIIFAVAQFVVGSIVEIGYCRFNLDLVDRHEDAGMGTLFGFFSHWKTTLAAKLLQCVYVALWSLLFVIPGIIATYSYSMTGYILAEHPELSATEAINMSKQMMYGNRVRLFCLDISFIGWDLLCLLTFGIGNLWLSPYKQAARAAFYREVSGTEHLYVDDAVVSDTDSDYQI